MNTYEITITTAPEKDTEGRHFKTITIEADRFKEEVINVGEEPSTTSWFTNTKVVVTGNTRFYVGDECVGIVPNNCVIVKK